MDNVALLPPLTMEQIKELPNVTLKLINFLLVYFNQHK